MFDFIPYLAILFIVTSSKSYQEVISLSLLVLILFFVIKVLYIYNKNKKMGTQIIILRKTSSEERSVDSMIIITIVVVIFFLALAYFFNKTFWLVIPWQTLAIFNLFYEIYTNKYLQKGLMENGVCNGNSLIEWDRIQSFTWVIPKKKVSFGTLKIGYTKFYSYHVAYLSVIDEQKEDANELFRKKVLGQ